MAATTTKSILEQYEKLNTSIKEVCDALYELSDEPVIDWDDETWETPAKWDGAFDGKGIAIETLANTLKSLIEERTRFLNHCWYSAEEPKHSDYRVSSNPYPLTLKEI